MERRMGRKSGHLGSCEEELRGGKPMWVLAALNSSDRSREQPTTNLSLA